jgi:RNA polymerase sigma factor (TIGR02999 family)
MPAPITILLRQWSTGSEEARDQLISLVYHELKNLSSRMLRGERSDCLTATALVHELYVKLAGSTSMEWSDRNHFFSFCARLMRQILIDQARQRGAEKRTAVILPLGFNEIPWMGRDPASYVDLDRALEKLNAAEPDKARVVEMRVYLGCTAEETAEILGMAKATVDRHMSFAKAWLFRSLRQSPGPMLSEG